MIHRFITVLGKPHLARGITHNKVDNRNHDEDDHQAETEIGLSPGVDGHDRLAELWN